MYSVIEPLHSFIPYLLIAAVLASVLVFGAKRFGNRPFKKGDKSLALVTLILAHIQLLIGLVLYFVSPVVSTGYEAGTVMSDSSTRLYAMEHPLMMIIAIVLITIGYSRSKKKVDPTAKFQNLLIFYGIALVLILSRIPWGTWPSTSL